MNARRLMPILALLAAWLCLQSAVRAEGGPPSAPGERAPGQQTGATTCAIGLYLLGLHDLDLDERSFAADFWIWSVCPDETFNPIDTLDFVNADSFVVSQLSSTATASGAIWSKALVEGVFRHDWDLADFPFDRHALRIEIEDSERRTDALVLEPDTDATGYDPEVKAGSWQVTGQELSATTRDYATTFGDPDQSSAGVSEFSRLVLTIDLERRELTGFFKLTAVLFAAVLLALITYFLHLDGEDKLSSRLGFVSGAVFTAALNMRSESSELGSASELTLIDKMHVTGLVVILVAAVVAIGSRVLLDRGRPAEWVRRINRLAMVGSLALFVGVSLTLIAIAA
jgi:hypothetical protein